MFRIESNQKIDNLDQTIVLFTKVCFQSPKNQYGYIEWQNKFLKMVPQPQDKNIKVKVKIEWIEHNIPVKNVYYITVT